MSEEQVVMDLVGVAFLANKLERRVNELEAQVKALSAAVQTSQPFTSQPIGPVNVTGSELPPKPAAHAAPVEPPIEHGRAHRPHAKRGQEE